MLATRTFIHRSVPLTKALKQPRLVLTASKAFTTSSITKQPMIPGLPSKISVIPPENKRFFSTSVYPSIQGTVSDGVSSDAETLKSKTGYVTKKLRVLDMDVVEKIKNELRSVDVNSDGR